MLWQEESGRREIFCTFVEAPFVAYLMKVLAQCRGQPSANAEGQNEVTIGSGISTVGLFSLVLRPYLLTE